MNLSSATAAEGATFSKKSNKRQEQDDEELVSRVCELVVADVCAKVRASFDAYVKELWTAVQEVKVRNRVDDRLVVKGSHSVKEKSRRHRKGQRNV